jgi:putative tryptophan/tyrosine transport system substrate-binding protein
MLQGTQPNELPDQAPVKYERVIDAKTAKALNIAMPLLLLARADEVIQ